MEAGQYFHEPIVVVEPVFEDLDTSETVDAKENKAAENSTDLNPEPSSSSANPTNADEEGVMCQDPVTSAVADLLQIKIPPSITLTPVDFACQTPGCTFQCAGQDQMILHVKEAHNHHGGHQSEAPPTVVNGGSLHGCDSCQYITNSKKKLALHRRVVHEGRAFKCEFIECNFVATRPERLRNHRQTVHDGVRYNCNECDFSTMRSDKLALHKKVSHQGFRYNCEQCGFSASRKDKLTIHVDSVHNGIKYPCNLCEYQASRKDKLKQHIRAIHEKVKYPCPVCSYQAPRPDKLREHIFVTHQQRADGLI